MTTYHARDKVSARSLLPAIGLGLGVGAVVAYFTQLMLRKRDLPSGTDGMSSLQADSRSKER